MKNNIKKILSTTIAAVALSACVTVPSSLNTSSSKHSIVNSIEADAANSGVLYTVKASSGVNVRSSRSTANRSNIKGAAAYGRDCYITQIVNGWGYTDAIRCNNGWQSGWIYMENLQRGCPFQISASSLRMRQNPGSTAASNTVLTSIPRNTVVIVFDMREYSDSVWFKTTYNGKTGWICWYDKNGMYCFGVSDWGTEL